jgi:hypothetical protein
MSVGPPCCAGDQAASRRSCRVLRSPASIARGGDDASAADIGPRRRGDDRALACLDRYERRFARARSVSDQRRRSGRDRARRISNITRLYDRVPKL